jgi:hypothetical protein
MKPHDDLHSLAQRARQGDLEARATLRHRLQPQVERMVRHALKEGETATHLGRSLLAAVRRLGEFPVNQPSQPARPAAAARGLVHYLVDRLWPGFTSPGRYPETVAG